MRVGEGDLFIITHKIVSKAEGRIVPLDSIKPSKQAARWASKYNKDPRLIELGGVIPDFRQPDRIRLGLAPVYTRFTDVWDGLDRLRTITP